MSYLGGYYNLLFLPFYADSKVVINNPFNSLQSLSFFKLMNKHQINHLWLTPSIAKVIMGVARSRDNLLYFSKNKVRIFIGMDSITNSLKNEFKKKFKVKIYENYGLSETLFISSESKYKKGSFYAGKILKGIKVKILNKEKNQKLKGEILVKSRFLQLLLV